MEFSIKTGGAEKQHHNCVVVGVYESQKLSQAAKAIDELSSGDITKLEQAIINRKSKAQ